MLNPKILEEVSSKLAAAMAASPLGDVEKNARAVLMSVFAKLDLVTREEFDVQREVLARTREKLAALERRVAEIEAARTGEQE
jgi:BMFP domain-containing protein YqiC